MEPSVDIVILSWDRLEETKAAISSALAQIGVQLKVIVIDQGSKQQSLRQLREFCELDSRIILVCNPENLGVPGGRNLGAYQGQAKYLVSLDNDAEFIDPQQVAKACQLMDDQPELSALAFRILCFGTEQDDASSWSYHQDISAASSSFYTDRFVGAGHMLRRQDFEQIGGYDDALFFLHEEVDLAKRLINNGGKIVYSPQVVIGHKVSNEHRVAWTDGRWAFDVRNKTYLHIKFRTFLPTAVFHTGLLVIKGFRSKMLLATLLGLGRALAMSPKAIHAWRQPAVVSNPAAKAYFDSCSPTQGMSVWQRVKIRIKQNKHVPENVT
ncbi:glycosyltransferase family 2 protein [Agarivorans sp.]|uniref:glycosyltransferase family 2 protein n=1 Tax=Agarivorans sp. TaxID=1872412 RepID=UPI003D02CF28